VILAHRNGLLTACAVLKRDGEKVRVKVADEKRPKWIDLSSGKQKLFNSADEAFYWLGLQE
jgi:hypothetical protein